MEWVLIFQTTYAKILADTGQFDRAEGLLELVSESRRSHLGQMHNTTIDSYANFVRRKGLLRGNTVTPSV